jgi:hypothetical protein
MSYGPARFHRQDYIFGLSVQFLTRILWTSSVLRRAWLIFSVERVMIPEERAIALRTCRILDKASLWNVERLTNHVIASSIFLYSEGAVGARLGRLLDKLSI